MSTRAADDRPLTLHDLRAMHGRGERIPMLTAADALTAEILDEAGVPVLLVGDSLAMVALGHQTTLAVTVEEMLHHTRAVARGARRALIVADMPFLSYQASVEEGLRNAGRFLKEAGAHAVKVEGGRVVVELVARCVDAGIPVMGHLGLTPQSQHQLGGYRVQGRQEADAERIVADARALADAGAFSIVLEAVPSKVGRRVTEAVDVPIIGIGAGADTDGQVLVVDDLLGRTRPPLPRFVKAYADLRAVIAEAARAYCTDVASGAYPAPEHRYD